MKESEVEGGRSMEPSERVLKKDFRMSLRFFKDSVPCDRSVPKSSISVEE